MIKNIIFDIGMVLVGWYPETISQFLDPEVAQHVYRAIWGSGNWECLDLGVEEDQEVVNRMLALEPDYREEILYMLDHLELISEQFAYAKTWIRECKEAGYGVYYLSNYSRLLRERQPGLTDFEELFDGGIYSSDVKMVKPDHKIYNLLCDRYDLKASECLFIDDRPANVEAAKAVGMDAKVFAGSPEI